ncbi:phage tail terminator-like protein [Pararhodospirillum photometricum]|uniref:phage tail terminator-like protein n=1 Tax=Pararhodospirillum photometricum TaxID=1084 RepID=UPI0002E9ADA4|nr:phage tail terminator-like protein [Pararhodospirillum photometricum]
MSTAAFQDIVRQRLAAWSGAVVRPGRNTDFQPPRAPWVDVDFPGAQVARADMGADEPLWEEVGAVMIHVFVPPGTGDRVASALADSLARHFLRWAPPAGVTITERMQGQAGPRDIEGDPELKGRWWGVSFGLSYVYQFFDPID